VSRREESAVLACALAILLAGAAIGASIVATWRDPAPTVSIDDGAIDYADDRPLAP